MAADAIPGLMLLALPLLVMAGLAALTAAYRSAVGAIAVVPGELNMIWLSLAIAWLLLVTVLVVIAATRVVKERTRSDR